jgi:biotin transport system substrate-specific component
MIEQKAEASKQGISYSLGKTRRLTLMALNVALLAISAYISFPLPFTPAMVTALTIVVNLAAFTLKPKEAGLTLFIWILLGCVGVPVFVGGTAGLARLVSPTGGFIFGFWFAAILMSAVRGERHSFKALMATGVLVGMPVIYIFGCIGMYAVAGIGVWATLISAVFPFIFGDLVKTAAAALIASHLHRYGFGE